MRVSEYKKMLRAIDSELDKDEVEDKAELIAKKEAIIEYLSELEKLEKESKDNGRNYRNPDAKIESIERRKKTLEKELQISLKRKSADLRDFLSTLIGQIDKKIHNRRFAVQEDEIKEKMMQIKWELAAKKINKRYSKNGLLRYFVPRAGLIAATAVALPTIATALGPIVAGLIAAGLVGSGAVTLGKTISTIYNKIRYNGPRLERQYKIRKGHYSQNIRRTFKEMVKSKPDVIKLRNNTIKGRLFGSLFGSKKENNHQVTEEFMKTLLKDNKDDNSNSNEEINHDEKIKAIPADEKIEDSSPISDERTLVPEKKQVQSPNFEFLYNIASKISNLNPNAIIKLGETTGTLYSSISTWDLTLPDGISIGDNPYTIVYSNPYCVMQVRPLTNICEGTYNFGKEIENEHLAYEQNKSEKPSINFNKALEITANRDDYSEKERYEALMVLINSFGNRRYVSIDEENNINKLIANVGVEHMDQSQLLKALSYYGSIIKYGNCNESNVKTFANLLRAYTGLENVDSYVNNHVKRLERR